MMRALSKGPSWHTRLILKDAQQQHLQMNLQDTLWQDPSELRATTGRNLSRVIGKAWTTELDKMPLVHEYRGQRAQSQWRPPRRTFKQQFQSGNAGHGGRNNGAAEVPYVLRCKP